MHFTACQYGLKAKAAYTFGFTFRLHGAIDRLLNVRNCLLFFPYNM